jgi:hypothetical protein
MSARIQHRGQSHNYRLERTGCKSESAPKKSREESALFSLGKRLPAAAHLGR